MALHLIDENEDFIIAVVSIDKDEDEIVDSIQNVIGLSFEESNSKKFEDLDVFEVDTIILHKSTFILADWTDLLEEGINLYIVS